MSELNFHVDEGDTVEGLKAKCRAKKHNPGFPDSSAESGLPYNCVLDDAIVAIAKGLPSEKMRIVPGSHCAEDDALRAHRIGVHCRKPFGRIEVQKASSKHRGSIFQTQAHTVATIEAACPWIYERQQQS